MNWNSFYFILQLVFALLLSSQLYAQNEAEVINRIARHWECQSEYSVKNGRVDLITNTHAYEVEKAYNWKHSIGQALWYALQTNRKAGIILIIKDKKDFKFGMMLNSTLQHSGLHHEIEVLYYPQDIFPDKSFYDSKPVPTAKGRYWITSTGKRHNGGCRYYNSTKSGRFGRFNEGVACKICGG